MESRGGGQLGKRKIKGSMAGVVGLPALTGLPPLPFHASVALRWWRGLHFAVQEKGAVC